MDALAAELRGHGATVERRAEDASPRPGREEITALSRDLREFEGALAGDGPDAVLLASASTASLAAVLVATKLGIPVVDVDSGAGERPGTDAVLICQLADARLAPDALEILRWLRDTYTERR